MLAPSTRNFTYVEKRTPCFLYGRNACRRNRRSERRPNRMLRRLTTAKAKKVSCLYGPRRPTDGQDRSVEATIHGRPLSVNVMASATPVQVSAWSKRAARRSRPSLVWLGIGAKLLPCCSMRCTSPIPSGLVSAHVEWWRHASN